MDLIGRRDEDDDEAVIRKEKKKRKCGCGHRRPLSQGAYAARVHNSDRRRYAMCVRVPAIKKFRSLSLFLLPYHYRISRYISFLLCLLWRKMRRSEWGD